MELALFAAVLMAIGWIANVVIQQSRRARLAAAATRDALDAMRARIEQAVESPGSQPDRPIVVMTAATIEPLAANESCLVCGGHTHIEDHSAHVGASRPLRRVTVRCPLCGNVRALYFAIRPGPN